MIFVYAISSLSKKYIYVGQTDHIIRRFHEHNNGFEKTTKPFIPFELIFTMECLNRNEAREFEKYYKSGAGKRLLKKVLHTIEQNSIDAL